MGTSLAVQWLGLCILTIQSLIGELKSHKPLGAAKQNKIKGKEPFLLAKREVLTLSGRCQIWSND